jgi:MtN3 and saliva related transmembrane protein
MSTWTWVGWGASLLLVLTIGHQVRRQWRTGHTDGVSRWLYVGQTISSSGFLAYSVHLGDWVFICTNGILLVAAILGLVSVLRSRQAQDSSCRATR